MEKLESAALDRLHRAPGDRDPHAVDPARAQALELFERRRGLRRDSPEIAGKRRCADGARTAMPGKQRREAPPVHARTCPIGRFRSCRHAQLAFGEGGDAVGPRRWRRCLIHHDPDRDRGEDQRSRSGSEPAARSCYRRWTARRASAAFWPPCCAWGLDPLLALPAGLPCPVPPPLPLPASVAPPSLKMIHFPKIRPFDHPKPACRPCRSAPTPLRCPQLWRPADVCGGRRVFAFRA